MRRRVLNLAWPAVLEQLLNMSVGLVDTYIVGHLGAASLAAIGLSTQTLFLFWALFMAIGVGSTALVARRIGEGEPAQANAVAQQSILLGLLIGLLSAVLLWVGAPFILEVLGAEPEVVGLGSDYLRAVASTIWLLSVLFIVSAIMRGAGDTRTPMFVMLIINAINIVVAYTLANGVGPLPKLGVLGSGIGAATGRGLGGLLMVALLVRGRGPVRIEAAFPRPDRKIIAQILRIGLPAAVEQLFVRLGQILLATFITGLGTAAYAAHQVSIQALAVSYMPGLGFAMAATTLVGQELGAGRPERAAQSVRETLRVSLLIMAVMGVLVAAFPALVLRIFTNDADVISNGVSILRIAGLVMPLLGFYFTMSGSLRGAGDTRSVLVILTGCIWGLRVPSAYWLSARLGLVGIWLAVAIDLSGRALLLGLRFRSGKWKSVKV